MVIPGGIMLFSDYTTSGCATAINTHFARKIKRLESGSALVRF